MQQATHVYDDDKGVIELADGSKVEFDPSRYSSADHARDAAETWAKQYGIIGKSDLLVMFS